MSEHRPEVADVFRTYEKEFFARWGSVTRPLSQGGILREERIAKSESGNGLH
jgi:hypothetical protein